ncbi:speckle-type POZ protein B [Caerostris extrusa]|uniref:Speckle-type POZ protein B n=1 Tax=Caerostris extrusa TaxID=172846 RepID=A0AAV4U798_CAEEX|nr:speckle-type POZ protein B [Caerostris extrusa]
MEWTDPFEIPTSSARPDNIRYVDRDSLSYYVQLCNVHCLFLIRFEKKFPFCGSFPKRLDFVNGVFSSRSERRQLKMASPNKESEKYFTITWRIENAWYVWQEAGEHISSPVFVADDLGGTKWSLWLYPSGTDVGTHVGYFLHRQEGCGGEEDVQIDYELSFLKEDGLTVSESRKASKRTIAKGETTGFPDYQPLVFIFGREESEKTLTARCRMWRSDGKTARNADCFARTRLGVEEANFLCKYKGSLRDEKISHPIKSPTKDVEVMHLAVSFDAPKTLCFALTSRDEEIKSSCIKVTLMPPSGPLRVLQNCKVFFRNRRILLTANLSRSYLKMSGSKDSPLCLKCEVTFSTGIVRQKLEVVRYEQTERPVSNGESPDVAIRILKSSMESLMDHGFATDVVLKATTSTFPAHKSVLSARSPVFAGMFSSDTEEGGCGRVDMQDVDDDTARRLHRLMYTADVGELDWEGTCLLYEAAKRYAVLPLKERCSYDLKAKLRPSNACHALELADQHQDGDLKLSVQEFILKHAKEVINSHDWNLLVEKNPNLAAGTLSLQFKEYEYVGKKAAKRR